MTPILRLSCVSVILLLGACADNEPPATTSAAATPASIQPPPASPPAESVPANTAAPAAPPAAPAPTTVESAEPTAASTPTPTPEPAAAAAPAGAAPSYEVTCPADAKAAEQCQVDKDTYIGWRTFAGQCQVCHGGSGLGSTFAPNLLERFHQRVDYPRFVEVVKNGYTGQVGAMPAWKGNPNVEPHIDRLYRYLKARADGALPPGRPARKP